MFQINRESRLSSKNTQIIFINITFAFKVCYASFTFHARQIHRYNQKCDINTYISLLSRSLFQKIQFYMLTGLFEYFQECRKCKTSFTTSKNNIQGRCSRFWFSFWTKLKCHVWVWQIYIPMSDTLSIFFLSLFKHIWENRWFSFMWISTLHNEMFPFVCSLIFHVKSKCWIFWVNWKHLISQHWDFHKVFMCKASKSKQKLFRWVSFPTKKQKKKFLRNLFDLRFKRELVDFPE